MPEEEIKCSLPKLCRRCGETAETLDEAIALFGKRKWKGKVDIQAWCRRCRTWKKKYCEQKASADQRQAAIDAWRKRREEGPLQRELDL